MAGQLPPLQAVLAAEYADYIAVLDAMSGLRRAAPGIRACRCSTRWMTKSSADTRSSAFLQLPPTAPPRSSAPRPAWTNILPGFAITEAIRLFALESGKLPESLDKLTVPVPVDPMSGKPFTYSVADGVATLAGAPYSTPAQARHYRITLAK